MMTTSATTEILARAIDVCALRQAVYAANIANANVDGYQRLEVSFDEAALLAASKRNQLSNGGMTTALTEPQVVVDTNATVKLDEEMAAMAQNALRYQTLLGAYERSNGLLKMAIREGREG